MSVEGGPELTSVWNSYSLHCHRWKPKDNPRAILCLCHGVTEHMGRYDSLGELLAENGILVFGHDHVGHGRSEGERVHVEAFQTYVDDVIHHMEVMRSKHPDIPCLLMGHSMGGLIVAHVAAARQDMFSGLILNSTPLTIGLIQNGFLLKLVNSIVNSMRYLFPRAALIPWNTSTVSSMPEEVKAYEEDPLIYHGRVMFSWVGAMRDGIESIQHQLSVIQLPVLFIHGKEDQTVPIGNSHFGFEQIGSEDRTFKYFEGNRHEVLHDRSQEEAKELIKDWLIAHM